MAAPFLYSIKYSPSQAMLLLGSFSKGTIIFSNLTSYTYMNLHFLMGHLSKRYARQYKLYSWVIPRWVVFPTTYQPYQHLAMIRDVLEFDQAVRMGCVVCKNVSPLLWWALSSPLEGTGWWSRVQWVISIPWWMTHIHTLLRIWRRKWWFFVPATVAWFSPSFT